MKAIHSRMRRLQQQLCPDGGLPPRFWVTVLVGREFALDQDRCIEILGESGFLPKTRFGILSFCGIPDGLNARELEKYLRTNGAQICGSGRDQQQSVPCGSSRLGDRSWSSRVQMAQNGT